MKYDVLGCAATITLKVLFCKVIVFPLLEGLQPKIIPY